MPEQELDYQGVLATLLGWLGDPIGLSVWEPQFLAAPTAFFVGVLGSGHPIAASNDLRDETIEFELTDQDGRQQGGFFIPAESLVSAALHSGKELDLFVGKLRLKLEHKPRM